MTWHRTSRHQRGYGTAWNKLRLQVLKRDAYLCQACLRKDRVRSGNECHHCTPKAKGGEDDKGNLETLCHSCHLEADAAATGRTFNKPCRIALDGTLLDG